MMTSFTVGDALRAGRLVRVLADYRVPELSVHAVYLPRRHTPPKVCAFVDFLAKTFGDPPVWDRDLGLD
jgi:DNA-binding transcriptional LysR family regulator